MPRQLRLRTTRALCAAHDLQGHTRNLLPNGPRANLQHGAIHGQSLREAIRSRLRASVSIVSNGEVGTRNAERKKYLLVTTLCVVTGFRTLCVLAISHRQA